MTCATLRPVRIAGGIVAGVLVLAGCSSGSDASHDARAATHSSAAQSAQSAVFDEADVTFVQGMIPHHEGALEMAQLADGRARDPRVRDLAARIEAAQGPEIQTMTGWLQDWGQRRADDMGGMDHGSDGMGPMGMDMSGLQAATGAEFDRMFLEMMTEHHSGAVEMARTEIADGQNADAIALAKEISSSQTAEVEEMDTLLTELGS